MKTIVFVLALLVTFPVYAGSVCQRIGNFIYCTQTYTPSPPTGTTTCQVIGAFVYCN